MAEEKDVDVLIKEVEELLNECKKNNGVRKNYASIGYKNKQLADIINKNINYGENLLSKLFSNVEGDDDTGNGDIYYFINRNKKEGRYKIILDVEKGLGYIQDDERNFDKFNIEKIFTFNGQYDFTDEQIKEIDKKLKHSIEIMYGKVKKLFADGVMLNSIQNDIKVLDLLPNTIKVLGKSIASEGPMNSMVRYVLFSNWTTNDNINNVGIKNINKSISAFIDLRVYYLSADTIGFDNRYYATSNVYKINISLNNTTSANMKNKNEAEIKKIINDNLNKAIKEAEKHVKKLQDIYNSYPNNKINDK